MHIAWVAVTSTHNAAERSYPTSKVRGPHARGMVAKRRYPMSEVRGSS